MLSMRVVIVTGLFSFRYFGQYYSQALDSFWVRIPICLNQDLQD